jgi:hypothetical protein
MIRFTTIASLAALSVAFFAGCAVAPSDAASTTGSAISSKSSKLVGTWEAEGYNPANIAFYAFTFNSDGSYSAQGGCPQNGPGPHCFAITGSQGTWKTALSGPQLGDPQGAEQIVMDDQFGQETTYFYTLSSTGKTLSLFTQITLAQISKFDRSDDGATPSAIPAGWETNSADAGADTGVDAAADATADAGADVAADAAADADAGF